jgi:hypothetical protein
MLIPFGILSSAAGVEVGPTYELIATAFGTGSSGVITFSSIPATYSHLEVRFTAINSSSDRQVNLTMNGITSGSYIRHSLNGTGAAVESSASSTSVTSIQLVTLMSLSSETDNAGAGVINILDYSSTTKNTTIRALYGQTFNTNRIFLTSGALLDTAAITSLTFTAQTANFASNSRFSLYGIRGS